jgi:hypothetical protein
MTFPFMPGLDPSKLKPETLVKLTRLVQELPPSMLSRMQSLMHNAMAGFDVRSEMEQFERELPSGFREKMARLMYEAQGQAPTAEAVTEPAPIQDEREARLTVLRAVSAGGLSPEEALAILFEGS